MKPSSRLLKSVSSDFQWSLCLLVGAMGLWLLDLGSLPLRDWDEGTYAIVAREICRSGNWLQPTLFGQPFLLKPPLVEWLIALSYQVVGVSEWSTRCLPALLSALSVPLLYGIGRQVFHNRLPALCSALVYLTLLPVVRHGRLAMHDGISVSALLLLLFCLLKARHQKGWAVGAGIALGVIGLSKGILVLLLGTIALFFLLAEKQYTIFKNPYLWLGIIFGNIPFLGWYVLQAQQHGAEFWQVHLFSQSVDRIWQPVEEHHGPLWYYLWEILKYSLPWLIFYPAGLILTWQKRHLSWAKLALIGTGLVLGSISVMQTKLPWYVMPVYPFIALVIGAHLSEIWQSRKFSPVQTGFLGFLAIASFIAATLVGWLENRPILLGIGVAASLTLGLAAWFMKTQDQRAIPVLFSGMYLTLGILVTSNLWIWELNEAFPVKPVANLLRSQTPAATSIYTSFSYNRPSLDFYSDRRVLPIASADATHLWATKSYLLLDATALAAAHVPDSQRLGTAGEFTLVVTK